VTDSTLVPEIAELVRSVAKLSPETVIAAETRLVEDLGVDSLDLVGLFLEIQDRYDIAVNEDDVPGLQRVSDLASYVSRRLRTAAA
jgi:acyl carrier protein